MKESVKAFLSSSKIIPQAIKKALVKNEPTEDYRLTLAKYDIWKNDFSQSVPVYQIYHHVHRFMDECEIKDEKAVAKNGKVRKVLFLGYDGMRADTAAKIVGAVNAYDPESVGAGVTYGGIHNVAKSGGLYLAYCGGETDTDTQQSTSTSAGWTAQMTGVWGKFNGIKENNDTKNMKYKTFPLEYAEKGLSACVTFDWTPFFNDNLRPEIEYAAAHPEIKIKYINNSIRDTDGKSDFEKLTAFDGKIGYTLVDTAARDFALYSIENGDSIVYVLYDSIDANGHAHEFSPNCNEYVSAASTCDTFTYQILSEIKKREELLNEEWLIILANDHGGRGRGHGGQSLEERTTWIATNIPISEDMFGKDYDGHRENARI